MVRSILVYVCVCVCVCVCSVPCHHDQHDDGGPKLRLETVQPENWDQRKEEWVKRENTHKGENAQMDELIRTWLQWNENHQHWVRQVAFPHSRFIGPFESDLNTYGFDY